MSILRPKKKWPQAALLDLCDQASSLGLLGPLTAGNCSARISGSLIYVSRTGADLHALKVKDLLRAKFYRNRGYGGLALQMSGDKTMSKTSEWRLHVAALDHRPDVNYVLHAHPPFATAAGIMAREFLPRIHYYQAVLGPDPTPVVHFHPPGSGQLAEAVEETLVSYRTNALLLANHGVLVMGQTETKLIKALIVLEELCKLFVRTQQPNTARRGIPSDLDVQKQIHDNLGLAVETWPY